MWDQKEDGKYYTVPCAMTPRNLIDYMGFSVYTYSNFRFSIFCKWDGQKLKAIEGTCVYPELYDLRKHTDKRFVPEDGEVVNLAFDAKYQEIRGELFNVLKSHFLFLEGAGVQQ